MFGKSVLLKSCIAGAVAFGLAGVVSASADEVIVGLITKTDTNPFFVKMQEGAEAKAKELGVDAASPPPASIDGDNDGQVAAIENLISAGAKGFLIAPSDTKAIVPTIKKARDAGLLVIVLDTPLDPIDAADATFATDNFKAGMLIGQWAQGTLGDKAKDAKIVFLDLATNQPTVDYLRDQGFMTGLRHRREGSRTTTATRTIRASRPRSRARATRRSGRTAMENAAAEVTRTSTSSTRSTSRPRPAPTRR